MPTASLRGRIDESATNLVVGEPEERAVGDVVREGRPPASHVRARAPCRAPRRPSSRSGELAGRAAPARPRRGPRRRRPPLRAAARRNGPPVGSLPGRPTSSLNAGSSRIGSKSESSFAYRARPLRHARSRAGGARARRRPAREALAAGEVVEQRGVLRMRLDELASAIGRPRRTRPPRRAAGAGPRAPSRRARTPSRGAAERDDRRLGLLGERRPLHARAGEDEGPGGRVHPVAVELEHAPGPAGRGRAPRRVGASDSSCSLMIRSPASRAVHALTPKDVMPKWCRTGRYGQRPSVSSSISSRCATCVPLMESPSRRRRLRPVESTDARPR